MNDWMENRTDAYIYSVMFNVVEVLNIWAYLQGSFKRPKAIPPMQTQDRSQYCMACKNWKPERAHHCSIC